MAIQATAQQILDQAHQELGLPLSPIGTSQESQTYTQMLALINGVGLDLVKVHDWQFLQAIQEFTGDGTTDQFPLPPDFGRIVNQTLWNTNNRRMVGGPLTVQQWGWTQWGIVSTGVYYRYRIYQDKLWVFPTPGPGDVFSFYYISKDWVKDSLVMNGYKDKVVLGDDTPVFDRGLMVAAAKARLWAIKGFDVTVLNAELMYCLETEKGQNQGAPILHLGKQPGIRYIDGYNVPDGDWKV